MSRMSRDHLNQARIGQALASSWRLLARTTQGVPILA